MDARTLAGMKRIEREIYKHKMALEKEVQRNAPEGMIRAIERKIAEKEAVVDYVNQQAKSRGELG